MYVPVWMLQQLLRSPSPRTSPAAASLPPLVTAESDLGKATGVRTWGPACANQIQSHLEKKKTLFEF
jgi:hypothetical protein